MRAPPLPLPSAGERAVRLQGSVRRLVHRLAFELQVGPIGESGLNLLPAAGAVALQGAAGLLAIELSSSARLWHLAGVSPGAQGMALAAAGGPRSELFALQDGALLSIDPATGESRFRRLLRGAGTRIFAVPGGCAVSLASGGVALVRASGALGFRTSLPDEPGALVASEGLFLAQLPNGQLAGLDAHDGAELWRRRVGVHQGPLLLAGESVLSAAVDARGAMRIVALSCSSGETLWERPLPPTPGVDKPGALVLFGERCAALAGRGVLAFDASDGKPAFTRELPWGASGRLHPLHAAPLPALHAADAAAADGLLAVGPGAAAVHLDARGQLRWSRPALSPALLPPLAPAQQGPALLLGEGPVELVDAQSGRTLSRVSMADTDAAALLPDLSVLLHLRDGTLALMRLATHLSLV